MTEYALQNPFFNLTDRYGLPVTGGRLYIGVAGMDPEINPSPVFWDAAGTIPAEQPLAIKGGYVVRGMSPATPFADPTFSIRAYDALGNVIFYVSSYTSSSGVFAGPGGAALIGTADGNLQDDLDNRPPVKLTRADIAALDVTHLKTADLGEEGREGRFTLQMGSAPADPQQGIYIASTTSGYYWERVWDGTRGYPEWFGAKTGDKTVDNRTAILACEALCQTTLYRTGDYYIQDVLVLKVSGKHHLGAAGSRDTGVGGTRIVITGPSAAYVTGVQFGSGQVATQAECTNKSRWENLCAARDTSAYPTRASITTDPIDAVKAIIIAGASDCDVVNCSTLDSPIGFHVFACVNTRIHNCTAHTNVAGGGTANDLLVHFLVGGYQANFGYLGANASIRFTECRGFTSPGGYTRTVGFRLFGYIADTFVHDYEMSLLQYGIEIDGRNASGVVIPNSDGVGGQHQDVFFDNAVVDGTSNASVYVHDLNGFCDITFEDLYSAPASVAGNHGVQIANTLGGHISIKGGKVLAAGNGNIGIGLDTVALVDVDGLFIRDSAHPVVMNNVGVSKIEPIIYQLSAIADYGVTATGCFRTHIAPAITGPGGKMTAGISLDAACTQVECNVTAIDPGVFSAVSGDNKVWHNGAPVPTATTSFGTDCQKTGCLT